MADQIEVNPEFKGAGEKPGQEIWRVEQFEPVRMDPKTYGKFYNGDAYIVLNTVQEKGSNKLHYDLHFWLGKNSSQDEQGAAAMLTVELDTTVLRGSAVQYRETQSYESKLFLSYYKSGIEYLEGGVESGFNTFDPDDYIKRLFQVKGKNNVRIEQVECKCGSLNQGDVFVLDDGPDIWVWVGPHSERKEQLGGVEFAKALRDDEKAGRAHIHVVEEDWETNDEFFKALGSKDKVIRAADPESDDDIVRKMDQDIVLYQIEEPAKEGKKAQIDEIGQRPLQQAMLDSDNCYVLDSGYSGIYVWTGKNASKEFKDKVWETASDFMTKRGYPDWVTVTRCVDGGETPLFKQYFESWEDPWDSKGEPQGSNIAESDYSGVDGVDVEDLHTKPPTMEEWMPDDGSGTLELFRVGPDLELQAVTAEIRGVFFGCDSYVMDYAYGEEGKESHIIYFWQGLKSSTEEKGASAAHAVALDNKYNGDAVQVRVVMNKEPAHFMKVMRGRLVIFEGGNITEFKSFQDRADYRPDRSYMFQIRGQTEDETRAIEVTARGAALNANDVFLVDTPKKTYVWVGNYCQEQEKEMAKQMVAHIAPGKGDPDVIEQGKEPQQFWNAIDGEEPYYDAERKTAKNARIPSRLFHCTNSSGRFTVEEMVGFVQEDLDAGSVFLLDTYDEIFVWVGNGANEFEKTESYKTAYAYLDSDPTGRTPDNTLIIVVKMGFEPPVFTGSFMAWDYDLWNSGKTFHELIDEVGKENAEINLIEDEKAKYTSFYPLEVLQRNPAPEGVRVTKKEMYLEDEEFKEVFGMTKDQYQEVAEWKQNDLKKQHGLF